MAATINNGVTPTPDDPTVPINGNGKSTPVNGTADSSTDQPAETPVTDEALLRALISRKNPGELKLSKLEMDAIVKHVINDCENAIGNLSQYKRNLTDLVANWRQTTEEKDFPFEGCANTQSSLTSVVVEQMIARCLKAVFGGDLWSKATYIERHQDSESLDEFNQWWNWELRKVVKLKAAIRDVFHDIFVSGISTPIPSYYHETEMLHSSKTWKFDPDKISLQVLLSQATAEVLEEKSEWGGDPKIEVVKQTALGIYKLSDGGEIKFSLDPDKMELRADIFREEVTFDGVRINYVSFQDLIVDNTERDIEDLPFFAIGGFYSIQDYRKGLKSGFFINHDQEDIDRIIGGADIKQSGTLERPVEDLQDREEGTDSTASASQSPDEKWIEYYRWEGWWVWDAEGGDYDEDKLLQPAVKICAIVDPRTKMLLRIKRLEDLNKDGKRSAVKFGFIEEPGRFFPMGLAEWVRHIHYILTAVSNMRLDGGFIANVPGGFYKPTAGLKGTIRYEPGVWYPCADPSAIRPFSTNWNPTFGVQEEMLQRHYGMELAGLSEAAVGHPTSKRQSATEFMTVAAALDLRTEDILERILEVLEELLERILSLYQQYGPEERIFRVGGEGGVQLTKKFAKDRMSGRIELVTCGKLDFINEDARRQVAMQMFSLLMNQILVQSGVVGPDTIYSAITLIAKLNHYDDVPLHKPKVEPMSDPPEIEEKQMFAGQKPIGPTMGEDTNEHLAHHIRTAADQKLMATFSQTAQQLLAQHINETYKTQAAQELQAKIRAAMAVQAAQSMAKQGINPGQPGSQQTGENAGPGTGAEGAAGPQNQPTGTAPQLGQA